MINTLPDSLSNPIAHFTITNELITATTVSTYVMSQIIAAVNPIIADTFVTASAITWI